MPDISKVREDMATPESCKEDNENEPDFVEVDPTGRYGRYNEILGKGAFKTVYRAFDEVDGIEVAWNQVKVQDVLQSPEDLERLYSEVHLLKTLKHKNIIKFYNSWIDTKTKNVNFITEIFTSGTLRQYRKKHKHVDMKAVKSWARQVLRGLLYLHSHDPPIIHRDLKCDNIFVNGNQGEVKIGDLGLATILRQAYAAHSVIGTPEFMAPELYEEEYNELVDIYSFGMCVLEMVTFEYPYSECANAAQIYKKVTSGKKPAALDKVKDPETRSFVEKCLATASKRLPARELLMDPFLHSEGDRETLDLLPPRRLQTRADDMEELGLLDRQQRSNAIERTSSLASAIQDRSRMFKDSLPPLELGTSGDKDFKAEDGIAHYHNEPFPIAKNSPFSSSRRSRDFKVKGKRGEDDTIFLRLRIGDHEGHFRNIHFPFDIEADTALSVASEMVAELDLSDQDVTTIAEMIDSEILALVPSWKAGAAFDESIGIDVENSSEWHSEGFGTPQTNKHLFHYASLDPLLESTVSSKPCSYQSPSYFADITAASPSRGEHSIRGRFEEVPYRASVSDCSFQSEGFPDFSSDSSRAQEADETLLGGVSSPGSPSSDACRSSTDPLHPCVPVQADKRVDHMDMQPGRAIDEFSNLGLPQGIHGNFEAVLLDAGEDGSALNMTVLKDQYESLKNPESDVVHDRKAFVEQENEGSSSISSMELTFDTVEDSVAEELRTLAFSQEQELRELQHKHQLALLEIQKRSRHKCGSFPPQATVDRQGYHAYFDEQSKFFDFQGGNFQDLLNSASGEDVRSKQYPNESQEPLEEIGDNCVEKPEVIDISEETEAGSCVQESMNTSKSTEVQHYSEMEQPQLENKRGSYGHEKYDLESTSSASQRQHQIKSGCSHILLKDLPGCNTAHCYVSQLPDQYLCEGPMPMGVSTSFNANGENLLGESRHRMSSELPALESKHGMGETVSAAPVLDGGSRNATSLVLNRRGTFVEYYKAGGSQMEKSFVPRGGLKGLDVLQGCECNPKDASISRTEAGSFEQQKQEEVQKSIAELEAKTLEGLNSSQTRYSVSCRKKTLAGATIAGQTVLPKSQVGQQNAAEPNKA